MATLNVFCKINLLGPGNVFVFEVPGQAPEGSAMPAWTHPGNRAKVQARPQADTRNQGVGPGNV